MKARISLFPHVLSDVALESHNCSGVRAAQMSAPRVDETSRVPWRALPRHRATHFYRPAGAQRNGVAKIVSRGRNPGAEL